MADLLGIIARVVTGNDSRDGTDDRVYLGVVGTGGGSEFPLDVPDLEDFERGSDATYWFGEVWDGGALTEASRAREGDGENDPRSRFIDLDRVRYVYLRKHRHTWSSGDSLILDECTITLYGTSARSRVFQIKPGSRGHQAQLGDRYGLRVYLTEE